MPDEISGKKESGRQEEGKEQDSTGRNKEKVQRKRTGCFASSQGNNNKTPSGWGFSKRRTASQPEGGLVPEDSAKERKE